MRQQHAQFLQPFAVKLRGGFAVLAVISMSILLAACLPGGGDDEEDEEDTGGTDMPADFAGTWSITGTTEDGCDQSTYTETYIVTIEQDGASATIDDGDTIADATVNGDTISWSQEMVEAGGTTAYEGTGTISGETMSGTTAWSASSGSFSCSGTSTFEGTRVSGGGDGDGTGGDTADGQELEPNDTTGNATPMSMTGTSVTYAGTSDDTSDPFDYYSFAPASSGSFTVTLDGDDDMDDLDVYIYDSNGNTLAAGNTSFGPDESAVATLYTGLVYYIEVVGYDTLTGANYMLTVTQN